MLKLHYAGKKTPEHFDPTSISPGHLHPSVSVSWQQRCPLDPSSKPSTTRKALINGKNLCGWNEVGRE